MPRIHRTRRHLPIFTKPAKLLSIRISPKLPLRRCLSNIFSPNAFSAQFFNRSDFTSRNIIAVEIEKVSSVLMQQAMSRDQFLEPLNPFYVAIENAATLCKDFSEKQHFLNTVYERFFQGFCVKVADTHGIVYTPQPIVDFMVNSVEHLLQDTFHRSLSDAGVHIIDPFVGTRQFHCPTNAGYPNNSIRRKI